MSEEPVNFEKTVALERRQYWQHAYQKALDANDEVAAARALRFIQEYDEFIKQVDAEQH